MQQTRGMIASNMQDLGRVKYASNVRQWCSNNATTDKMTENVGKLTHLS
jgi:hypothetical protein